jgi:ATP-dependent DNA helicase RecQ
MNEAREALERVFGFASFAGNSRSRVRGRKYSLGHADGIGQSLCYQLPAIVRKGLTIVVSPLIALMRDQL